MMKKHKMKIQKKGERHNNKKSRNNTTTEIYIHTAFGEDSRTRIGAPLDPEILVILLEFFFTVTSSGIAKPEATYRKNVEEITLIHYIPSKT
jgi:hypothetical protein